MIYKFNVKLWKRVPKDDISIYKKYEKLKNDYYKVIVSDTYEEMYDIADKLCLQGKLERNYNGLCKSMYNLFYDKETEKYINKSNKVGYIFFVKDWIGAGVVSHECTHAVNYYFRQFIKHEEKIFKNSKYDETFAYMLGSLVNQIYTYLYKNKILE